MTYLGLDLGTGFAKLARCAAAESVPPDDVPPDDVPAAVRVPAAVHYDDLGPMIPSDYLDEPRHRAVRCDGFPAMLGTSLSDSPVPEWRNRTPAEVAGSFLERLLEPLAVDGVRDLVAAVQASESAHGDSAGSAAASELADILAAQDRAPERVVPAPVAALLWLRRRYPELATASRVAVIDAGAGSVDVALCMAAGDAVRVVDSMRVAGSAAWEGDNPAEIVARDRPPTLAECLVAAMVAAAGERLGQQGRPLAYWWRAFERAMAEETARDRLGEVLRLASQTRQRLGGTNAVRFGGLAITASQLMDACEPLCLRAGMLLGQLLSRQADPGWSRFGAGDATRLLLIGGLHVLRPLPQALLASVGVDPDCPDGVVLPGNDDLLSAAACGAALVAAGWAEPGDRYPYGLCLTVSRVVRDRLLTEELLLAAPGSISLKTAEITYPVRVTVRPPAPGEPDPVPVRVRLVSRGAAPVPAAFKPAPPPPPGVYQVGVRGGPDGPAVVLRPVSGGAPLTYPLAERQGAIAPSSPGQAGQ